MATFGGGTIVTNGGTNQIGTSTSTGVIYTTASDEYADVSYQGATDGNLTVGSAAIIGNSNAVQYIKVPPNTSFTLNTGVTTGGRVSWVIFKNSSG